MRAIIVDSSAWVAYFRGEGLPLIDTGLAAGLVRIPPLLLTDLLSVKQEASLSHKFEKFLEKLPLCEVSRSHFARAGELKRLAAQRGIRLSAQEAHIAQCALDLGGILVTKEPLFHELQRFTSLKVLL